MVKSFKHKGLADFFYTGTKKGIRPDHSKKLGRILDRFTCCKKCKGYEPSRFIFAPIKWRQRCAVFGQSFWELESVF
jgi:hypothetical protein